MSLVILQCDTCPATFTTDKNPDVGVHWSQKWSLMMDARGAGWVIDGDRHLCPECTARALARKRSTDQEGL